MQDQNDNKWFQNVESIIEEPLKFKAKLAIGEDAYTSLRIKNRAVEYWDTLGAATAAATIAGSSAVATTFFAPSGILAAIGLGTAVTPIGWVIAAGIVTSGAWMGVTRYIKKNVNSRVTVIPDFINTPMDVLGLALFDFIAPLALKVAVVDGEIHESERNHIRTDFIEDWGYSEEFVTQGMSYIEDNLADFSITKLAKSLAEFKKGNPDCNYSEMSKEILHLLRQVIEVDGRLDEREDMAIERVERVFKDVNKVDIKSKLRAVLAKITPTNILTTVARRKD